MCIFSCHGTFQNELIKLSFLTVSLQQLILNSCLSWTQDEQLGQQSSHARFQSFTRPGGSEWTREGQRWQLGKTSWRPWQTLKCYWSAHPSTHACEAPAWRTCLCQLQFPTGLAARLWLSRWNSALARRGTMGSPARLSFPLLFFCDALLWHCQEIYNTVCNHSHCQEEPSILLKCSSLEQVLLWK